MIVINTLFLPKPTPRKAPRYEKLKKSLQLCRLLAIFFLAGPDLLAQEAPDSARKLNVSVNEVDIAKKVDVLLSQMTLDEKIGQMVQFADDDSITGPTGDPRNLAEQVRNGRCGSIFNALTVAKIRKYQKMAIEGSRLKIPLIFGFDVIHGYKTIFPIPLGEAASWDLPAIERSARVAAIEASAAGLNWTFAPMVDIARDPRWGRGAEGAGEDVFLGGEIAKARVRGFQGNLDDASCIAACVKHFAAYGAVQAGREYNTVDMSERMLRETYLPPYKAAVDQGALTVMTSFCELNGIPATANTFLLNQVLKGEWGFKGFVVTDYTAINELTNHGIAEDLEEAGREALEAGVDMDMHGAVYFDHLKELVAKKQIATDNIDDAVRRILSCKFKLGLFDDPFRYCNEQREATLMYAPEHLEAAYEMACRSIVLLKNESQTLPIKKGANIAVIGPLAQAHGDLMGCWSKGGEAKRVKSIFENIKAANSKGRVVFSKGCDVASTNRSQFSDAINAARNSDLVVLVMGESGNMSGEAKSRTSINLPGVQTELLKEIKKVGKPIVLVLLNGRPLALEEESKLADALLEAWQPGTEGGRAVAAVLFGDRNPCGKLPVTFPRNLGQVPIFYAQKNTGRPMDPAKPANYKSTYIDSPNDPLYPFGFGLSYSAFKYSEIELDKKILNTGDNLVVSGEISNIGKVDGEEIVQLYIRDLVASVARPVLELKGFQKILLKAGEIRKISFSLGEKDLAFLRRDMTVGTEPGMFQVFVGSSSKELKTASFELVDNIKKP